MGLKDRLRQAKCATGFHTGEWQALASDSCDEQRVCSICGNVSTRVQHDLADWQFVGERSTSGCLAERRCNRCGVAERENQHSMDREYVRSRSCRQRHVCSFCGYTNGKTFIEHEWGELIKIEGRTGHYRYCLRCDAEDRSAI